MVPLLLTEAMNRFQFQQRKHKQYEQQMSRMKALLFFNTCSTQQGSDSESSEKTINFGIKIILFISQVIFNFSSKFYLLMRTQLVNLLLIKFD